MGFIISKPQTSDTQDSAILEHEKPEEKQKPEEQKKEPSEEFLKKLEEDAYKKVISNECTTGEGLQKILKSGFDEFKDNTGRNMTYAEMRRLYG